MNLRKLNVLTVARNLMIRLRKAFIVAKSMLTVRMRFLVLPEEVWVRII